MTLEHLEAEILRYDKLSEKFDVSAPVIKLLKQVLEQLKTTKPQEENKP